MKGGLGQRGYGVGSGFAGGAQGGEGLETPKKNQIKSFKAAKRTMQSEGILCGLGEVMQSRKSALDGDFFTSVLFFLGKTGIIQAVLPCGLWVQVSEFWLCRFQSCPFSLVLTSPCWAASPALPSTLPHTNSAFIYLFFLFSVVLLNFRTQMSPQRCSKEFQNRGEVRKEGKQLLFPHYGAGSPLSDIVRNGK